MRNIQGDNMNRIEAIELLNKLKELKKDKVYNKFLIYAITKSISTLEELLKEIQERENDSYSEEYKTYNESRISLLRVYSKKDEAGNPIVEGDQVKIDESKQDDFDKAFKELFAANESVIKETNEKLKELEEWVKEDSEITLTKISFKYIPDELTQEEFETLSNLIKSEDEIEL